MSDTSSGTVADMEQVKRQVCNCAIHVVTGPSGCGKTTFVEALRPSLFMTQYHSLRPEGRVDTFFPLDVLNLPYPVEATRKMGGMLMPGLSTKGLSGGQRKLCILAHVDLVARNSKEPLLIVLDEPIAGVTSNYIPYFLKIVNQWPMLGHSVVIIDNDHHEVTTTQDWIRVKLDVRKVIEYNSSPVDISVPLVARHRVLVANDVAKDIMLYVRKDMRNRKSTTHMKHQQMFGMSCILLPLSVGGDTDNGSLLLGFQIMFFVGMISGTWTKVVPTIYARLESESSLGLVTRRGTTVQLIIMHEMLLSILVMIFNHAVHAMFWKIARYGAWDMFWGVTAAALWSWYPLGMVSPLCGVHGAFTGPIVLIDTFLTVFVAGQFSPVTGLLPGNQYGYLANYHAALKVSTKYPFLQNLETNYPENNAPSSLAFYMLCMIIFVTYPSWGVED